MKSKGEKVNWDEQATKAAAKNRHDLYEEDEDGYEFWGFSSQSDAQDHGFEEGAKWQREQLRTDEAVERLALFLLDDEGYDTSSGWPSNEQLGGGPAGDRDTELKDAYMGHARTMITALLGG